MSGGDRPRGVCPRPSPRPGRPSSQPGVPVFPQPRPRRALTAGSSAPGPRLRRARPAGRAGPGAGGGRAATAAPSRLPFAPVGAQRSRNSGCTAREGSPRLGQPCPGDSAAVRAVGHTRCSTGGSLPQPCFGVTLVLLTSLSKANIVPCSRSWN